MKLIRNWAWALCSALLCLSYSASNNAQDVTGNLVYTTVNPPPPGVQFTWGGFVSQNTGGGGFSGGNVPAYNSQTGTFIFGYNQGTVSYSLAVNSALTNSGSGLQVSGLNYSWQYYNQDFSRGTLSGTIGLTSSTGKVLESYNYTMPKTTTGWTTMSGTQTFSSDYSLTGIGNLTVSFTGKDDRYWAGYYGPQIRDIDVRLRYMPAADPCATNPAQNPSCPEYFQKYVTPTSTGTVSTEAVASMAVATSTASAPSVPTTTSSTNTSASTVIDTPVATTSTSTSSTTATPTSTVSAATNTSATPSATNPQPRVGEVAISGSPAQTTSSQSGMSLSQALNIVRAEQNRVSRLETSAVATAVEQATRESEKVVNEAQSVAAVQQAQVAANNESATNALVAAATTPTPSLGSGLQVGPAGVPQIGLAVRDPVAGTQIASQQSNNSISEIATTTSNVVTTEPTMISVTRKQELQEAVSQQTSESSSSSPVFSTTNPLNNYVNPPAAPAEAAPTATGPVVNRNVQPNSAAGGRDITVIATAPPGFDAYTAGTVPDGAFYAPREIYRNQRTVDNARAQRALSGGSDRLHQEMIEQQYRNRQ